MLIALLSLLALSFVCVEASLRRSGDLSEQYEYHPRPVKSDVCAPPISVEYETWCAEHPSTSTRSSILRGPTEGDNITALVLLVKFPEHSNRNVPSRDYIDTLCNGNMSDYLYRQSYGQYKMNCNVQEWIKTPFSQALYSNTLSNLVGHEYASSFLLPILEEVKERNINHTGFWEQFDSNTDGAIDLVMAFHSGYGAEFGRGSECGAENHLERFYSQGHASSPPGVWSSGKVRLSGYAITSAFHWVCEDTPATMGIATHEWIHTLRSAPDLYGTGSGRLGGIGHFGVMASARGFGRDGHPAGMTAYTKRRVGWLDAFMNITRNGHYDLRPLNYFPEAYAIQVGFGEREFLLLENRQAVDDDVEMFEGGLLIYHVNDREGGQGPSGYPGVEGWPENLDVYKVALLQADGNYDLEMGNNNGDAGDIWKPGMKLRPRLPGDIFPNTDSYFNGPTGITIEVLEPREALHVRFRVSGLPDSSTPRPSTEVPTGHPTLVPITTPPTTTPSFGPSTMIPMAQHAETISQAPTPASIGTLVSLTWVPLVDLEAANPTPTTTTTTTTEEVLTPVSTTSDPLPSPIATTSIPTVPLRPTSRSRSREPLRLPALLLFLALSCFR